MTPVSGTNVDPSHGMAGLASVQPEQLFCVIFEQAAVGVALIETATGRFVRVNQRYCDIVGLSHGDMTATTFMAITHPADLQADLDNMEELKADRIREFCMEKRYLRSDGSLVWVDLTVSPLWKAGEQPSYHIAVVQDVTARKRTEALLETDRCILERIASGASLTEVLEKLCCMLEAMSPGLLSSILLLDQDRVHLRHGAAPSLPAAFRKAIDGVRIGPDVGSCGTAAYLQRQVIVTDIANDPLWTKYREIALKHHVCACWSDPIFSNDGSVLGTFAMYYRESRSPNAHDLQIKEHATRLAAIAIERKQAEQNLALLNATLEQQVAQRTQEVEESRQQLQAILDGTSDAVFVKDLEGRYRLINKATEQFVGKRQDDVIGHDDRFIFSPAEAQAVMDADRKVVTGGVTMTYEDLVTTADGVQRTFLSTKGPLLDDHGRVTGLFGISRDITARKRAEEALRESEERLRLALEGGDLGSWDVDLRTGLAQWNRRHALIQGYEPIDGPVTIQKWLERVHPEDLDRVMAAIERAKRERGLFAEEHRLFRADNSEERWLSLHGRFSYDEAGEPVRFNGVSLDITERRRSHAILEQRVAERTEELRISEQFRKEILDSLSSHVAVLDASGVIVAVNRVWEHVAMVNDPSGLARVSIGANYVAVCERAATKNADVRRTLKGIRDVLAGRKSEFEREYLCTWPGHQQWFSMRVTPLSDRGGCVIAHENISDRKRSEEALRTSYQRLQVLSREVQVAEERERGRLSRELHDGFGQLLSALKFDLTRLTDDLAKKAPPASVEVRRKMAVTAQVVDRLFLSLREMVQGLRPAVLEKLGLVPALEALVAETKEHTGLDCCLVVEKRKRGPLLGPELEGTLYRVAQELLTNVVRHARATSAAIRLRVAEETAVLMVQDNGHGIHAGRTEPKGRYGLRGVRERIELLGGHLDVKSELNQGTSVTVTIPAEPHGQHRVAAGLARRRMMTTKRRSLRDVKNV